ncbi:hypothetical protein FHR93_002556 [Geodermatophilus sabuli]|nr:hypothetical protein [Geodermatophilus sabuli]
MTPGADRPAAARLDGDVSTTVVPDAGTTSGSATRSR